MKMENAYLLLIKRRESRKWISESRKQLKTETVSTNDWDSKDNAKKWREDLARTINEANEQIGLNEKWEHESFWSSSCRGTRH